MEDFQEAQEVLQLAIYVLRRHDGGPNCYFKDGDIIEIDIPNRKLNVKLSDNEN